ncbi:acetyltransferase (GNAT) family protein [Thermosporothrix hazakensis]|jgi:N-acetylglutamate synthase-like GNAT family acetyltransferase|uniref:Acetyltransferase (GNAT) family protein n=1 Tax=Thermosporothrix hazakensis TaxID=644383 RepID=A0A326UWJ4_THEHA|nr:GNAT family N-acetyltransferase [Thermosporothrix hazakensis]PZW36713.1 acetyltransferase (GNAT) family protein [Thermosporothrix hazakensis]GCE47364.1 hypothetical protein KTH_22330 [Thermosporothrix hazakensis]
MHHLADIVWRTEWHIATAGNHILELPAGQLTYNCAWHDQHSSHQLWIQQPGQALRDLSLPCLHPFELIVLAPGEWADFFPEPQPPTVRMQHEWGMWLPASAFPDIHSLRLGLTPAQNEADWATMFAYRFQGEQAFGITDSRTIRRMIEHIRWRQRHLESAWYLAHAEGAIVGGIGLVCCNTPYGKVGRLQDVNIIPAYQGKGFGNELLHAICQLATTAGLQGLCLRADAADWPKNWYARYGFEHVATWTRFKGFSRPAFSAHQPDASIPLVTPPADEH